MADISSIKMPNGSIYDLKDKNAQTKINVSGILEGDGQGGISESDILDYDTDTTSGSVVSFIADGVAPLRALTLSIDPIQDLHGYDAPWPGGGGVNKFDVSVIPLLSGEQSSGTVLRDSSGNISVKASARSSGTSVYVDGHGYMPLKDFAPNLRVGGTYTLSFNTTGTQKIIYLSISARSWIEGTSITITQDDLDSRVYFYASGASTSATISKFQIEEGSTATTYAPYSNLCPISGWTGANLWRTGRNLDPYDNLNSTTRLWGSNSTNQIAVFKSLAVGTYTMSCKFKVLTNPDAESTVQYGVLVRYSNGQGGYVTIIPYQLISAPATVGAIYEWSKSFTLTESLAGESTLAVYFYCASGGTSTITANAYDIQLELSSTPTPYTPYTGTTIPVTFTEAGTVYGGVWDVLNGVLTVDRASITLVGAQSETWSTYDPSNYDSFCFVYSKSDKTKNVRTSKCNLFKNVETAWGAGGNGVYGVFSDHPNIPNWYFRLPYSGFTETVEAWKEWLASNPLQIVYELATPLTYILTPQQLDTLTEQNVLWADSGAVSLEYRKGENALLQDISEAIKNLQGKIRVSGLLKSDGNGNVTAAINGTDYSKVIIRDWSVT